MALKTTKHQHAHVLPFVVLAAGIIISTLALNILILQQSETYSLRSLLTIRLYDISPSSNGLAHISRHNEQTVQINTVQSAANAGQSALLQASVFVEK